MPEWVERVMRALGWMPVERERALEDALERVRSSHDEDRAALEAFKRDVIRVMSSWEKAEARVRELEAERAELVELWGSMNAAKRAGRNCKLQVLGCEAAIIAGGKE